MADVVHDPKTDWCACESGAIDRCDYRLLADAVIDNLEVRDGDEAEVALCIEAVERVADLSETGRWQALRKYLEANAAERAYEDYDVGTPERARLRARAETFALVRQHMAELEAEQ